MLMKYCSGGLETEGIFRISASLPQMKKLKENVEEGKGCPNTASLINSLYAGDMDFTNFTVHDVACLIKLYFRELPEPLFPSDLYVQHL